MAVAAVAVLAAVVGVVIGRNSQDDQQVSTEPTSTEAPGDTSDTSPPAATPTAADDLAAYFAAAQHVDAQLQHAAELVNGGIQADKIVIDQATVDAAEAADERQAAVEIPAGLPPDLLEKVLVVQSDLTTRSAALSVVGRLDSSSVPGTLPVIGPDGQTVLMDGSGLMLCLRHGSEPAAEFARDLAAAKALAAASPPIEVAAPDSRAAAEVAVHLMVIHLGNYGCDSCGGTRLTELPKITWHTIPGGPGGQDWDGDVDGVSFQANYTAGKGWVAEVNAC